ncbi:uracil phosphoribosyltransferase [Acidisoma cellulosilytica]|uniref:Uracil phosphoribosyltransferase n=1 Tax=Acidisoma cellulosilyticum TaxID=2802395 RepID=A0A964E6B0_9PROT|nr:uracil phosphoribosyltransferase [Acidisoma cellulosilyticum]MCB8882843.1 uracil phosphoribosyltransferase [Acidisoma cellulosilyticum]
MPAFPNLTIVSHPLVQHKLTLMRRREKSTNAFRQLLKETSLLLGYEVMRDLPLQMVPIETPLEPMMAPLLAGKKLCFVSVLRAGDGLLDGLLDLVPSARVGHIGLYRDSVTKRPVEYLNKLPEDIEDRLVIAVDPMLATGYSAAAAVEIIKKAGASQIRFVSLLAAPEGVQVMLDRHPDVPVFTAALDRELDEHAYIRPGLGDAGDRLFGTK